MHVVEHCVLRIRFFSSTYKIFIKTDHIQEKRVFFSFRGRDPERGRRDFPKVGVSSAWKREQNRRLTPGDGAVSSRGTWQPHRPWRRRAAGPGQGWSLVSVTPVPAHGQERSACSAEAETPGPAPLCSSPGRSQRRFCGLSRWLPLCVGMVAGPVPGTVRVHLRPTEDHRGGEPEVARVRLRSRRTLLAEPEGHGNKMCLKI